MNAPNRNIYWAKTFVDALAQSGLEAVCIAPGSRSTPLVIAFAENPHIKVYSHIDERSAAFFALGLALASGKPAALVCSSGTATANFHPAIIEARYANIPLLVLTADRPHEMRDSGANQTIDQVKMFGTHVLWAYDAALPENAPPAVAIRGLKTLAARAYAIATGNLQSAGMGPVHINFPFRKPLEPTPVTTDTYPEAPQRPTQMIIQRGKIAPHPEAVAALSEIIQAAPHGLIICGATTPPDAAAAIVALSQATGYPIFADTLSQLRAYGHPVISSYDTLLSTEARFSPPDIIIHFGAIPASGNLEKYLNSIQPLHRYLITAAGTWTDGNHHLTDVLWAEPALVCQAIIDQLPEPAPLTDWAAHLYRLDTAIWQCLTPLLEASLFDGAAAAATVAALPDHAQVWVASSLPVRHIEQFVKQSNAHFYANRGASGIDGTISSALGVAAQHPQTPTALIIGDLAFYHDLNGLLAFKRCDIQNCVIVLLNNDGGGIFHRLPIAQFDPPFTDLFLTPHGLDFEPIIRAYGLAYQNVPSITALQTAIQAAFAAGIPTVIEVRTQSQTDHTARIDINQQVNLYLQARFP